MDLTVAAVGTHRVHPGEIVPLVTDVIGEIPVNRLLLLGKEVFHTASSRLYLQIVLTLYYEQLQSYKKNKLH